MLQLEGALSYQFMGETAYMAVVLHYHNIFFAGSEPVIQ